MKICQILCLLIFLSPLADAKDITRIWLTHQSHDPGKIVVARMSDEPGDAIVRFGETADDLQTVRIEENRSLMQRDADTHYSVNTGNQRSTDTTFKSCPTNVLGVAEVAKLCP